MSTARSVLPLYFCSANQACTTQISQSRKIGWSSEERKKGEQGWERERDPQVVLNAVSGYEAPGTAQPPLCFALTDSPLLLFRIHSLFNRAMNPANAVTLIFTLFHPSATSARCPATYFLELKNKYIQYWQVLHPMFKKTFTTFGYKFLLSNGL